MTVFYEFLLPFYIDSDCYLTSKRVTLGRSFSCGRYAQEQREKTNPRKRSIRRVGACFRLHTKVRKLKQNLLINSLRVLRLPVATVQPIGRVPPTSPRPLFKWPETLHLISFTTSHLSRPRRRLCHQKKSSLILDDSPVRRPFYHPPPPPCAHKFLTCHTWYLSGSSVRPKRVSFTLEHVRQDLFGRTGTPLPTLSEPHTDEHIKEANHCRRTIPITCRLKGDGPRFRPKRSNSDSTLSETKSFSPNRKPYSSAHRSA